MSVVIPTHWPSHPLSRLLHYGQVHVLGVIENPTTIAAGNQLLLCLAAYQQLRRHSHVTPAANAMLHGASPGTTTLSAGAALAVLAGYAAVLAGAGATVTVRREIGTTTG